MMNAGKRWSLIHGHRFLVVLLVISMIHVAASQNKMSSLDQGLSKIRSPRYAKTSKTSTQSSNICSSTECIDAANQINSSINHAVDPCDDFYEYACGRWPQNNIRPPGYPFYSDYVIAELKTENYQKNKLEKGNLIVNGASNEVQQMPSDLYNSCMNVTAIENLGDAPLRERITELGGWDMSGDWDENTWDFNETLLLMHKMKSNGPLFTLGFVPAGINKTIWIRQAGPSLVKEQYLNLSSQTMLAYRQLIIDVVLELGGNLTSTARKADEIIHLETQLANVSSTFAEHLESLGINRTLEKLQVEVPELNWTDYMNKMFAPVTIPKSEIINLSELPYLKKAMKIIQKTQKRVVANYMVWYVIREEIAWLSKPFRDVQLKYENETKGTKSEQERSRKCIDSTFKSFNDLISAAYIQEHHDQLKGPKIMANEIANEAIEALKQNVNSLTWLDGATRSEVFLKLAGLSKNVGYPDYMLDSAKMATLLEKYNCLNLQNDAYFKNKASISKQLKQHLLKTIRKPKDDAIWFISPLRANAIYNILKHRMTFPIAILERPILFPNKFLRSYNLGKFGVVTGHELMHGYGTFGRLYDKDGRKTNWWTNSSLREFSNRLKCYEKQYSNYKVLGKWPINGKLTAEENIADNGGLKIALKAYYNWARRYPSETWRLQGLTYTNEQLFYIGFAQDFCHSSTDKQRYDKTVGSTYADHKFRVIGSLVNSCEFANAFKCKRYSPMNPINKCYLWSKEGLLS